MKTTENSAALATTRRQSTAILLSKLNGPAVLPQENKQLILQVLRQRGIDVSSFTGEPVPEVKEKLSEEKLKEVNKAIDLICEFGSDEIKLESGNILENISEYEDLTETQADALIQFSLQIKNSPKKKSEKVVPPTSPEPVQKSTTTPVSSTPSKKKEVTPLTEDQKSFVEKQLKSLSEKMLSKKQFITSLIEAGFERLQVTKLVTKGLIDETYVYDLYKAYEKLQS